MARFALYAADIYVTANVAAAGVGINVTPMITPLRSIEWPATDRGRRKLFQNHHTPSQPVNRMPDAGSSKASVWSYSIQVYAALLGPEYKALGLEWWLPGIAAAYQNGLADLLPVWRELKYIAGSTN